MLLLQSWELTDANATDDTEFVRPPVLECTVGEECELVKEVGTTASLVIWLTVFLVITVLAAVGGHYLIQYCRQKEKGKQAVHRLSESISKKYLDENELDRAPIA